MKIKNLLFIAIVAVTLSSCSSMRGFTGNPESENSGLIYGYIEIVADKTYKGMIHVLDYDRADEWDAARALGKQEDEWEDLQMLEWDSPMVFLDKKTGLFVMEITEPGYYFLCDLETYPVMLTANDGYTHYFYDAPESEDGAMEVRAGEMVYWGSATFNLNGKLKKGDLEAHSTMTREDVLDLAEEKLAGKGWDDWFAAERARL